MENQKENHKYLETNGDYRMRELDKSDLEQFNALLQYAFQVTSYELLQTGWEQDEIKYAKRPHPGGRLRPGMVLQGKTGFHDRSLFHEGKYP